MENERKREEKNLGTAFAAVGAADELDVTAAVLVATTIPALESLPIGDTDKEREREIRTVNETSRNGRRR